MLHLFNIQSFVFLFIIFVKINGQSNKERTFIKLNDPIPCVRRFNATHQIGCGKGDTSSYDGIVYVIRNQFELNRLESLEGHLNGGRKLVIAVIPFMYEKSINLYKRIPHLVNGIVLLADQTKNPNGTYLNYTNPTFYSPDSKSPNKAYGLYTNKTKLVQLDWNNPAGTSFMFESFDVPIYILTSDSDAKQLVENCYEKFNQKIFERADSSSNSNFEIYSTDLLCGMRLGLEMSGAVSSRVCIRRSNIIHTLEFNSFCDPLGGSNYFTFLSHKPSNEMPIVILSTRIDAFTMFEYYTPAASEPISSIIGMLSLAELLSKYRVDFTKANILFVLFDNEAFEYGGSSRFANDLALNQFPSLIANTSSGPVMFQLKKDNLTTMIELSQLGSLGLNNNGSNFLYIHKDPISYGNNKTIQDIIETLQLTLGTNSNNSISPVKNLNQPLAPSSLHSFLKENLNIGGIVIADHETSYKNAYYHSVFDTPENLNIIYPYNITEQEAENYTTLFSSRLQTMMTSLLKSVYNLYTDKKTLNDQISILTINRLSYCFYVNTSCLYFKGIMSNSQWKSYQSLLQSTLPKQRLSFYTSVNDNNISGKWLTHMLLRYFTRNTLFENFNSTDCNKDSLRVRQIVNETNLTVRSFVFVEMYNNKPNETLCVASSLYSVSSISPAFAKSVSDGILVQTDRYSAWTESSWSGEENQMKLFMFTCDAVKYLTILLGAFIFVISFIITYFINKYSNKIFSFNSPEQSTEIIE